MTKYSLKETGYKKMYLINKFEKGIMENSLLNMTNDKEKLNENLPPVNVISQETQTNSLEGLNETIEPPNESTKNIPVNENSISNFHKETNNNIEENTSKNNDLDKYNKDQIKIKHSKNDKNIEKKLHSNMELLSKGMKTRNFKKGLSNHPYKNTSINKYSNPSKKIKKSKSGITLIDEDEAFYGWKL